jgi:ribulose-phosphate 3-epimerase
MKNRATVQIAASILSADFARLGEQVSATQAAGADRVHVDVMDGLFVPNITVGPLVVHALRPITSLPIDVHLMIERPERYIPDFIQAGANSIFVHVETCPHLYRTIEQIKELGAKAGVTLNPATPLSTLEEVLPEVDMVLIMSVSPGFGNQVYLPNSTDRIARLRQALDGRGLTGVDIAVDGGIKVHNIAEVAAAGANIMVIGSAIFNQEASVAANIAALREGLAPTSR